MTTVTNLQKKIIGNKQHVLILDDDFSILKSLKRLFFQRQVPWKYSFASHVDEALETIQTQKIDMIITDIKMPGKDGFHMLKCLRESPAWNNLQVMMFTAFDYPQLKTKALELGAVDLITKPIKPNEMLARIHSVLEQQQRLKELNDKSTHFQAQIKRNSLQIKASKIELMLRLAKAAEFRNYEDCEHATRVGYYSKILSKQLGLNKDFSDELFVTSPLHDIGKVGIPDSVLLKKGKFTPKDRSIMNSHCQLGYDLLKPQFINFKSKNIDLAKMLSVTFEICETEPNHLLEIAAEIALGHHEWFNGNGYPYGRKGERIPLSARIVAIGDVYDALRTRRSYKTAYSHIEAMTIIKKNNVSQFDPDIFSGFEKCAEEFNQIFHAEEFNQIFQSNTH